jgi:hypothetical protein
MLITETGFKKRTLILLERFDKFFFIDDALIRKFGGEVRPFNFATDEIFRDKKQPNKNNKNNVKGNAGAGAGAGAGSTQRTEGMTQQHSPTPPIPVSGPVMPMVQQPFTPGPLSMGGGGGNMESFVPEYAEPMAANAALGGGGWGSAW